MRNLTLGDFRQALNEFYDDRVRVNANQFVGDDLLDAKLKKDLGLDSLGSVVLSMVLKKVTNSKIDEKKINLASYDGSVRGYLEVISKALKEN